MQILSFNDKGVYQVPGTVAQLPRGFHLLWPAGRRARAVRSRRSRPGSSAMKYRRDGTFSSALGWKTCEIFRNEWPPPHLRPEPSVVPAWLGVARRGGAGRSGAWVVEGARRRGGICCNMIPDRLFKRVGHRTENLSSSTAGPAASARPFRDEWMEESVHPAPAATTTAGHSIRATCRALLGPGRARAGLASDKGWAVAGLGRARAV